MNSVGSSESHDIGQSLTVKIGMTESHEMAQSFDIKVGIPGTSTEFKMDQKSIVLSTGKASITLSEGNIFIEATEEIHFHAAKKIHLSSKAEVDVDAQKMTIDTVEELLLNCESAKMDDVKAAEAGFAQPPGGPAHGSPGTPPVLPHYQGVAPVQPGGLEHVNVGEDLEEKKPEVAKAAAALGDVAKLDPAAAVAKVTDIVKDPTKAAAAAGWGTPIHDAEAAVSKLLGQATSIVGEAQASVEKFGESLKQYIPAPLQDLLSSKLGKNFVNGAVTKLMTDHGIPTSMNELAAKGVDKMTKAIGYDGNNKLQKALFGGTVDEFKADVVKSMGAADTQHTIDNFLGGLGGETAARDAAKKAAEEAAKKAAEAAAKAAGSTTAAATTQVAGATAQVAGAATQVAGAATQVTAATPAVPALATPPLVAPPPVVTPKKPE